MGSDMPELLPCPFCGSHAFDWREGGGKEVQCDNRGSGKENCPIHKIKFIPGQWNTRYNPHAARIAVLEDALQTLKIMGEEGMIPDYSEWLSFHDKVAQIARQALNSGDKNV